MIKTKLSQQDMKNLNKFQQKLQELTKIQSNMYQRIIKNQQHTLSTLQKSKQQRKKCLKQRPMNMKAQTFEQIIKHPANDNKNNGGNNGQIWMYLANFIQQKHDLSQVEKRMLERKRVRQEMERVKEEQRFRQEARVRKERQDREYEQRIKMGKGFSDQQSQYSYVNGKKIRNKNNKNKNKVPFNLQRQLHRRQVQQNRRRLQRMEYYKRQTYYENNLY